MKKLLYILSVILFISVFASETDARKITYNPGNPKKTANSKNSKSLTGINAEEIAPEDTIGYMLPGSFMVASQCEACNRGYRLNQIEFNGFDKLLKNGKESFFITNHTDRTLTGVTLYIDYRTPDGRQLTKRFIKLSCNIPAGETRKADIQTFDTQRSFYYLRSERPKKGGNPFDVIFDPVAYYLQF